MTFAIEAAGLVKRFGKLQPIVFASMGTGIGLNTDVTKGIFDRFRSRRVG
jgi:hypothetical protein